MKLKVTFLGIDATLFAITLALSLHEASLANAQTPSAAQIVFLHFKIKDETITLVKANTRPGVVKQKRGGETRGGIYYDVVSASGKSLWNGGMEDPLVQRIEYGDPADSGRIKIKNVTHEEAGFTLRMPFRPDAHRIEFYRLESSADQNRRKILRRPIGSILLQMKGDEPK
ncbi:hypothetical protein L0337_16320 [candidate division KSB1 bacterium]|nr:hypothetical protein [candidate division KSB1 bacterium]